MWECGLKLVEILRLFCTKCVTPCVGVWIEIPITKQKSILIVTPCVGVWIEMYSLEYQRLSILVTPCVGVWIEI